MILVCAVAAAVIEPSWNSRGMALVLRVRSGAELSDFVRAQSRALGRRAAEALEEGLGPDEADSGSTPPVGAALETGAKPQTATPETGTTPEEEPLEGITPGEQQGLDRLVEEAIREP
jgi:hypothetical protein